MLPGSYLKFVPQQFVSDLLLLVCCLTAELREGLDPPVLVLSLKRESSKEACTNSAFFPCQENWGEKTSPAELRGVQPPEAVAWQEFSARESQAKEAEPKEGFHPA